MLIPYPVNCSGAEKYPEKSYKNVILSRKAADLFSIIKPQNKNKEARI
jgi:hypothetical protein